MMQKELGVNWKGGNIELLEYFNKKRMKSKRSLSSHNCLGEGHHARRGKMRPLVRARLVDLLYEIKLAGYKL